MEIILFSNDEIKLIKQSDTYYFLFNTLDGINFIKKNINVNDLNKLKNTLANIDLNKNIDDDYDFKINTN